MPLPPEIRLPLAGLPLLLAGCGFGLTLDTGLGDGPGGPGGPGDSGGPDDTDTNGGGDTDDDTHTGNDTDTDTDDPGDEAVAVESVTPDYGTTAGGIEVTIRGGPFDSATRVSFGGTLGTVVSTSNNQVTVRTPATSTEGEVDVVVTTQGGSGTLTSGFMYFEDGTGKAGVLGSLAWYDQVGTYWDGTPQDFGSAWFLFTAPTDVKYWELYASSLDTCASEYIWNGDLYYYDTGLSRVNLQLATGATLEFTWDATEVAFVVDDLPNNRYTQGQSYDLPSIAPTDMPSFSVSDIVQAPSSFSVSSPNLAGSTPPTLSKSLSLSWSGSGGDAMVALLMLHDASGAIAETVTCAMRDDGSFSVPGSTWTRWASNRQLDVLVGRVKAGTGTVPFNNADSEFAGVYWVYGAGFTQ